MKSSSLTVYGVRALAVGATALCSALAFSSSSDAATVTIGYRLGGVGPVTVLADSIPQADLAAFVGPLAVAGYENITLTGSTNPTNPLPNLLGTTNLLINAVAGAQDIEFFVTTQGLDVATPLFASAFTSNTQTPFFTLTETTYLDVNDGLFSTATLLDTAFFSGAGALSENDIAPGTADTSYSLTAVYAYDVTGAPFSNLATITVAAVPGPIVGAGLPGLILACGGLLTLARRRRKAQL